MSEMHESSSGRKAKVQRVKALDFWRGAAVLYKVEPPVQWETWTADGQKVHKTDHVVVSAAVAAFTGPETYIFPTDKRGNVLDWMQLPGSFRGACDHDRAIKGLMHSMMEAQK